MGLSEEKWGGDPKFWMNAYWNEWLPRARRICRDHRDGDTEWLREHPVVTFSEYVSGDECDFDIIPNSFISQTDRLASIYNNLISREELDLDKMDRVVNLAQRIIYRGCSNAPL